ncbi:hypothetical protein SLS58_001170 [Diplodia intermedia]|uniref:Xylanolytic transcriptional activator regulatory domain-containing protein n=1 Tax=Diplodia intermedia TaxID=856260 RepID=A0ABR3U3L8_9PEZI
MATLDARQQPSTAAVARPVRRKYTSKACEECRPPVLTPIECRYRFEEDGRRPASKSYVQLLRTRIEILERVMRAHGIDVDAEVAAQTDSTLVLSHGVGTGAETAEFEDLCVAFEGALSFDESLNFDQDGELRYFGPTSGRLDFHPCGHNGTDSSATHAPKSPPRDAKFSPLSPSAEDDSFLPEDVKEELISLYFLYVQPWHQVVNESLFRESYRSSGRFSGPLLLNCILALGSRYTDRPELRSDPDDSNTAGAMFLDKAKVLLSLDLQRPSVTTLQSLCLIATMHFAVGADAAGWLHSGMAIRLALDMGMNLDSDLLARSDLLSAQEADLRRQIYWALYCDDKLAVSYTGRVCTMLPALKGPQKVQFLSNCILELKNWFYDLPSEMRIDRPSEKRPPQVYTMHMVYHNSFILLMKPFLGKEQQRLEKLGSLEPNNNDMAQKAASICYEASRQMVLVTRKYRHAYGSFRRSPITATYCSLSAALTLLQISKLDSAVEAAGKTRHIARMVEACLEVLQELSTSWDIARRLRESLVKLYRQFSSGGKVASQTPGSAAGNAGQVPDDDVPPLTSPTDDPLPFFLEDPSAEIGGYATLGDFTEEMLLDESLWESAGQDLAFDPLQNDYMGAGSLDCWRFDDIW